ncbi:hypothetical protein BJ165DRAFT_1524797 [Panaeolus papilionaceus]|nr:hypothetical protein BJ165DRAFT_1524797 [Panaeolus papilionaceus]
MEYLAINRSWKDHQPVADQSRSKDDILWCLAVARKWQLQTLEAELANRLDLSQQSPAFCLSFAHSFKDDKDIRSAINSLAYTPVNEWEDVKHLSLTIFKELTFAQDVISVQCGNIAALFPTIPRDSGLEIQCRSHEQSPTIDSSISKVTHEASGLVIAVHALGTTGEGTERNPLCLHGIEVKEFEPLVQWLTFGGKPPEYANHPFQKDNLVRLMRLADQFDMPAVDDFCWEGLWEVEQDPFFHLNLAVGYKRWDRLADLIRSAIKQLLS